MTVTQIQTWECQTPCRLPQLERKAMPQTLTIIDGFCPQLLSLVWNHNCTLFCVWGPPRSVCSRGFFFFVSG